MVTEEELRRLEPAQRRELSRVLARLEEDEASPAADSGRSRTLALAFILACCVGLAIWIGVLAVTLPRYYRAGGWRGAWVGFDVGLLTTFAATGWAAWRRRQVLIVCLIVLATLLCCDAWFDVVLDARTSGFLISLLSALLVELPLAALAMNRARQLLHRTILREMRLEGATGPPPPLWQIPLAGRPAGRPSMFRAPG